ncbi:hypothetical protein GE09DRAFT_1190076 [Coniochaeta sp. 2T2.1]|nr:hypothetical protein GE09DRAFT_1190076 [Coniochaeta sp. 2T2.1]
MVPQTSSPAARRAAAALSKAHCCPPRCQPWRAFSFTTRHGHRPRRTTPSPALAIEQQNGPDRPRRYATTTAAGAATPINVNKNRPKHVAVIGGGLTGLSTAWFLTKFMPEAKVTIYEGSGRVGGWIDTEERPVEVPGGKQGVIRFERGARMVQPKMTLQNWDDIAFYELWEDMSFTSGETTEPPSHPWLGAEAYDRYFYYPDHLVRLPNIPGLSKPVDTLKAVGKFALDLLREPLYKNLVPFGASVVLNTNETPDTTDLSIGDEFVRIGGGRREPVDNMLSAMCHGIYGGDVWKLSSESSIFGSAFWNHRLKNGQHAFRYADERDGRRPAPLRKGEVPILAQDWDMVRGAISGDKDKVGVLDFLRRSGKTLKSINFAEGFQALPSAIVAKLTKNPNVKFVGQEVANVRLAATGRMEVCTFPFPPFFPLPLFLTNKPADNNHLPLSSSTRPQQYDKVISTIYSRTLASLSPPNTLPSLASSTAVTIRVVNLWSPHPRLNHPARGFGYLIPQTTPAARNPHAALGVIFDSDRTPPRRSSSDADAVIGDDLPGTKLTVMLGGHHWDDLPPRFLPEAATDDDAAVRAAKETVRIQLGIPPEAWRLSGTKLCVDCIPQHLVGHAGRMAGADAELRQAFGGKLAVAGGSYTAPGVMGSVRAARDVAWQVSGGFRKGKGGGGEEKGEEVDFSVGETGLGRFVGKRGRLWHAVDATVLKILRGLENSPGRER